MSPADREALIEALAAAHRRSDSEGQLRPAPAFYDLDAAGRREAFARATHMRAIEAALHPQGLSSTAQSVLRRIRRR